MKPIKIERRWCVVSFIQIRLLSVMDVVTRKIIIDGMKTGRVDCSDRLVSDDFVSFQIHIESIMLELVQMHNNAGILAKRRKNDSRQSVIIRVVDEDADPPYEREYRLAPDGA